LTAAARAGFNSATLGQAAHETIPHQTRQFRYYDLVMAAFVVVLICSNLIGPAKIAQITLPYFGAVTFGAGVLFFPISYVFGDILTEVYGYARARKVIWAGFAGLGFASFMAAVVVALPPARSGTTRRPTRSPSARPGASSLPRCAPISAASSSTPTCWRR